VYATPVNSEVALHHRIVDSSQIIRNWFGISERMLWSMMRHVVALNLMKNDLNTCCKYTLSAITQKRFLTHVVLDMFLIFVGNRAQNLSAFFSYPLCIETAL
jgi:hypothetical protein